jgi:8-oxo-dGTP diphosphatase
VRHFQREHLIGRTKSLQADAFATSEERHSVAVSGVIFGDEGRVLLVRRRDYGNWEPPGGVLKVGESVQEGLTREVREETGLQISIERLTGVYENPEHGVLSLVFRCSSPSGNLRTSDEIAELRWVHREAVGALLTDDYSAWIEDASGSGEVPVRLQRDTVKGASSSPSSPLGEEEP